MEYTLLLVCLGLNCLHRCEVAGLLQGDAQDQVFAHSTPSPGKPSPIGGLASDFFVAPEDDPYEPVRGKSIWPVRGTIRKSFSLETTTPQTTPHFEALTGRNISGRPKPRTLYINSRRVEDGETPDIVDQFNSLKRGETVNYGSSSVSPSYDRRSYEERIADNTPGAAIYSPSGPNAQYNPTSESPVYSQRYPTRDEDLGSSLGSFSYVSPRPTLRPQSYRGSVKYTIPTSTEPYYDPPRSGKKLSSGVYPQGDFRRVHIEPTTYRPIFKPAVTQNEYSFPNINDRERKEYGNPIGKYRGTVKFMDTVERDKEVSYVPDANLGLVTTETPLVSNPGRSGQRYVPLMVAPTPMSIGGAYSYSFVRNDPEPSPLPYDNDIRYGKSYATTESYQPSSRSLPTPDGSYVFSYNAGDHERRETRDRDGNVRGMYSYYSPDGERKLVQYEAGPQRGFVAQGRHLPLQEGRINPQQPEESEGGRYFFSYDAGDHAREEIRDDEGNVRGSFSYLIGDGIKKTVHYKANPEDGFHIERTLVTRSDQYK